MLPVRVPRDRAHAWPRRRCPSSATTPTSWPAARRASPCWPRRTCRRSWTCPPWRTSPPSRAACRSSTSSTASAPPTRCRRSPCWDYDDLAEMCDMDAVRAFREHALNPEHPAMRGSHENGDIFFQHREACNGIYDALPAVVEDYMHQVNAKLGTELPAVQLLRRARRRPRDHGHGLVLRRGRGGRRLPERATARRWAW